MDRAGKQTDSGQIRHTDLYGIEQANLYLYGIEQANLLKVM